MRPLEGLLVVSVEQAVAAPYCTSRLADAGARVIKVERPEGDFGRGYDTVAKGQSSYFVWLNRGKESVILDLAAETGRAGLAALIAQADILVQNLKPGALARLGFPIETLRERYPALICCSISGYGDEGPLAERKAYDLLIQAESGLCSITGTADAPGRVGISIVDVATGTAAHTAILEALIGRAASGKGADIRISMFDVMADWLAVPLMHAEAGKPPARLGLMHPSISPYGAFTSKDGKSILISIQNDREWRSLCVGVLEDPSLVKDERFATNVARVSRRAETDERVARVFAAATRDVLVERLNAAEIAFGEVNTMTDLMRHPHLTRAKIATPNGEISYPAPAAVIDGARRSLGAVPALGENKIGENKIGENKKAPAVAASSKALA